MKKLSREEFIEGLDYTETIRLLQKRIKRLKPKKPRRSKKSKRRLRMLEEVPVLDEETQQRLLQLQAILYDVICAAETARYYYEAGGMWRDDYCCLARIMARGSRRRRYIFDFNL